MSEFNMEFVVSNLQANFTVETNEINVNPTAVDLTVSIPGIIAPGAPYNSVQYNDNGEFTGSGDFIFEPSTLTMTVDNANITGNAVIGNLTFTSNVNSVHITGGTNGYVLQTDGAGNLAWTAQTGGGGGNGSPGGANSQVQYNNSGAFAGSTGFTYNSVGGNLAVPNNITSTTYTGKLTDGYQSNIVQVGQLGSLAVSGNIDSASGVFNGNGAGLTNVIASTVTTNAQPNITSTGTLTSLSVTGTSSIQQAKEKITTANSTPGTSYNYDLLTQAIYYTTGNTTSDFTLNIRGNSTTTLDSVMSSNQSMTCTFIVSNGSTPYVVNNVTVDGNSVPTYWPIPGTAGTGTALGKDSYTLNILKLSANTFNVFATRVGYI